MDREYAYINVEDDDLIYDVLERVLQRRALARVRKQLAEAEREFTGLQQGSTKEEAQRRLEWLERKEERLESQPLRSPSPQRFDCDLSR